MDAPSERPWLVLVDLQRAFREPTSPWCAPEFDGVLPRVAELVEEHAGRVVLTRFVPPLPPEQPVGSWADYYRAWPFAVEGDPAQWDLVDGLPVPAGTPVVDRPTMGKWGPDLLAATGGSHHLVLAGVSTDCCVLSTALAAADAGAWVRVESAACAAGSRADHDRALASMAAYAPQVVVV